MRTLSIVTATYNREALLTRVYESILNQSAHDFLVEWVIIDDGSTDQTKVLIESLKEKNELKIKYYHQLNKGKMQAINHVLNKIDSDFYLECDSDDYLKEDALYSIASHLDLLNDSTIGALMMEKENMCHQWLGEGLSKIRNGRMVDFYYRWHLSGDKALVFKTDIRKQYQFIFESGESFSTEGRLYHQMNLDGYLFSYVPTSIMVCEYQDQGYTKQALKIHQQSPLGHFKYYLEVLNTPDFKCSLKVSYQLLKQYWYFGFLAKLTFREVIKQLVSNKNRVFATVLYLPALIIYNISYRKQLL